MRRAISILQHLFGGRWALGKKTLLCRSRRETLLLGYRIREAASRNSSTRMYVALSQEQAPNARGNIYRATTGALVESRWMCVYRESHEASRFSSRKTTAKKERRKKGKRGKTRRDLPKEKNQTQEGARRRTAEEICFFFSFARFLFSFPFFFFFFLLTKVQLRNALRRRLSIQCARR